MKPQFELSKDLFLPAEAVTEKIAVMGKTGSGKSYAAQKLAEGMLKAKAQIVVLDPIGNWYGLRLDEDGKSAGYDVLVLGGLHADLQLEPDMAKPIADVIVNRGLSVVLDVSSMRKGARKEFATIFAEELFHKQKNVRRPMHLFLEEAQVFCPQRTEHGEARLLGAFEDLVKIGRNVGIGATMITQRPQAVNKDVLNQAEMLLVFQLVGPQERKAVEGWVREKGASEKLLDQLDELHTGEAIVWSPSWLRVLKKIKIAKKHTFDASSTPKFGEKVVQATTLTPIDLEVLKKDLSTFVSRAVENDPEVLKKRIRELERQPKLDPTKVQKGAEEILKKEVARHKTSYDVLAAECDALRKTTGTIDESLGNAVQLLQRVRKDVASALGALAKPIALKHPLRHFKEETVKPTLQIRQPPAKSGPGQSSELARIAPRKNEGQLGKGPLRMLKVLATWYPDKRTRAQLATLSGMSQSGTFRNYLSELRTLQLIEEVGDGVAISPGGFEFLRGDFAERPTSTKDIMEMWQPKLGGTVFRMLQVLVEAHPNFMTREQLAERCSMTLSGTFRNYLSELRTNGLIRENGHSVAASDTLFLEEPHAASKAVKH